MSTPIPRTSPEGENPADDLKTDVVRDVERDDTITSGFTAKEQDDSTDD